MSERIKLYSEDYSQVLLATDDRTAAHQFFLDSGQDSMPLVIDFGWGRQTRWSGKLELKEDGGIAYVRNIGYLEHIIQWPEFR